ncbi:hypothetical protein B0T26DRAFT_723253, partial [Lasiosphaeria miniovina]
VVPVALDGLVVPLLPGALRAEARLLLDVVFLEAGAGFTLCEACVMLLLCSTHKSVTSSPQTGSTEKI